MPITRGQAASVAAHIRDTHGFTPEERSRLDAMTDADIEQAARTDPDAVPASAAALDHAVAERRRRRGAVKTAS